MVLYMEKEQWDHITTEDLKKIVDTLITGDKDYGKLQDYYEGKHNILNRQKLDKTVPNNRIVNNIAKYITDTSIGYFIGMPVVYSSVNEEFMAEIQSIWDYNDEQDHNMELAKGTSIYGSNIEMIYLDENADIRFIILKPYQVLLIRTQDKQEDLAAIRLIMSKEINGKISRKIELWTESEVSYFVYDTQLHFQSSVAHYMGDIPFIEYINNAERQGDYEGVITNIDAYNKAQSNTANLFEYNDDAILKVTKLGNVNGDDIKEMKEKAAIILEDGGDVDWLLKEINDTASENYKKRLRDDVYLFSNVPNMTDESFGGNLSGVAVSYKLWGLEQITALKERKFKKAIQRRIEIVTNILNLKGGNYNYMDIEISFRRNKPQNLFEIAQIITMLESKLSRETQLKMFPVIEDVSAELEKIDKEKQSVRAEFGEQDDYSHPSELSTEGNIE